ncbi:MAG: helix-turn-helix domain-containing protein [Deltaproteobacteria bacterium]|jgi:excisionase family DNA binding protein|nr:helix-turn-helix domain-containing protein [Deltaproteobacteria bacterium]
MDEDAIVTLQEVAALLRIGRKTAYKMVQRAELPAFRVRGQRRCRRADLDAWVAKRVAVPGRETREAGHGATANDDTDPDKPGHKSGGH